VTDGAVRDYEAVRAVGIPVFSTGAHPAVLGRRHIAWDHDVTIGCGGTTVQPGDVIVGDSDGVIVIPPALVEEIADAALAQEEEDGWIAEQVASGARIEGLFPMNPQWRERFEAARAEDGR
jgi:regulator of RNase E activity RraA